jgi:hypothetical protein
MGLFLNLGGVGKGVFFAGEETDTKRTQKKNVPFENHVL